MTKSARPHAGRQPAFLPALIEDARVTAAYRGERHEFRSRSDAILQACRLMLTTDAFFGQAAYRLKARLRDRGIPVLPWIAHRIAMMTAQISITDNAFLHPGVFIPHGQVVIDGIVEVHTGATLSPWVTVGHLGSNPNGPTIGAMASVGTGAKVLGQIEVGSRARVGANAVVVSDVAPKTTVVGMPAKPVQV
jgi:serine O-acetyltransferase